MVMLVPRLVERRSAGIVKVGAIEVWPPAVFSTGRGMVCTQRPPDSCCLSERPPAVFSTGRGMGVKVSGMPHGMVGEGVRVRKPGDGMTAMLATN